MKSTCLIIDDEKNNVANLQLLLNQNCPDVDILDVAYSADEGKSKIALVNPDLVFLDIQMPGKSGFDMLKEIGDFKSEIIFVTAFDEYAIHAMKFSAIDYLLKPINIEELKSAVQRAEKRISMKFQNYSLQNLVQLLNNQKYTSDHRIGLPTMKEIRFVKTEQIIRCEASNNYCTFYLTGGEEILVSKPIYEYEQLLEGYGFIRCHQSHIVNKNHIKSLIKETGGWFLMDDGKQIPISRAKKEILKKMF